ncbi:MAG: hypothetical protein WBP79_13035 [Candidatus Acidiferrales bacterium]
MPSRKIDARFVLVLLSCGLSLATGGCLGHKTQAATPVASAPVPKTAEPPQKTPPPDINPPPTTETPNTLTTEPPPSPPRPKTPRKTTPDTTEQPAETQRPPAPQISPELSPGDQSTYERKTSEDISVAEKNLEQANGKQLSAAQSDLAEKIRSFLSQSREAGKAGDWVRAQNLAQKARLLSVELVNSL